MDTDTLIRLVERYFAAVDRMYLAGTLDCFTAGATFTIATTPDAKQQEALDLLETISV